MNHLSVTGGRIDHGASSGNDTYMSAYNDNISSLKAVKIRDLRVFSNTSPAGGCGITLFYSRFIQTPVYKTGTVKCIGALCSPYIGAAHLGTGYGKQCAYAAAVVDNGTAG